MQTSTQTDNGILKLNEIPPKVEELVAADGEPLLLENGLPRFLVQVYKGMERDIAPYYTSYFYYDMFGVKLELLQDEISQAIANAKAKMRALVQSSHVAGAVEDSILYQLDDAHKTNWPKLAAEIEDVRDLIDTVLQRQIKDNPNGGYRYEVQWLVETFLPWVDTLGVDKTKILGVAENITKARRMVYEAKGIIAKTDDPEEQRQMIEEALNDVVNPELTIEDYERNSKRRMRGLKGNEPASMPAKVYLLRGQEMIVIQSDPAHTRAIEHLLRGVVSEFGVPGDPKNLLKDVTQRLYPREGDTFYAMVDETDRNMPFVYKTSKQDALLLPSPENFESLAMQELGRSHYYLDNILNSINYISMPVYTIRDRLPWLQMSSWTSTYTKSGSMGYLEICAAIKALYSVPESMLELYPKAEVEVGWYPYHETFGICVGIYA